jgi:hypothetical protein
VPSSFNAGEATASSSTASVSKRARSGPRPHPLALRLKGGSENMMYSLKARSTGLRTNAIIFTPGM